MNYVRGRPFSALHATSALRRLSTHTTTPHTMSKDVRLHDATIVKLTADEWATLNPVLRNRDMGINTTTGEVRWGPGTWNECSSLGNAYAVRVATAAPVTIATDLLPGDTIDGVVLEDGDLVLVKDQGSASPSAAETNGVYLVAATPVRATVFNTWNEHVGSLLLVKSGTTNGGKQFRCAVAAGGTLNSTAITYTQSGQGPLTLAGYKQLAAGAPNKTTPAAGDIIPLEDAVSGQIKYCTVAQLGAVINV